MRSEEFTAEAFDAPDFPEPENLDFLSNATLVGAAKLEDISPTLSVVKKDNRISLVKDNTILVGSIKLSPIVIGSTTYDHVDNIYIVREFRKTSAIKWLLYATKEYATHPIIADGAIFTDGQKLIQAMTKYGLSRPKSLNKTTGEKLSVTEPINDPNLCYIFESTKLGPGQNYFADDKNDRGQGWVWYASTLFDAI